MTVPLPDSRLRFLAYGVEIHDVQAYGDARAAEAVAAERERISALLAAIRAHWLKANGDDSISVSALDQIADVIADGSYVTGAAAIRARGTP